MGKPYIMGIYKMKKLVIVSLLVVFVGVSFHFINEPIKTHRSKYHSTELKQVVTQNGNVTRTDYIDSDGKLKIAANAGYATKIIVQQKNSEIETYLDDQGKRISRYSGYYGILREFDTAGNNIRTTYMDENNVPVVMSLRYAIEEKEFNQYGQQVSCRYFDEDGKPILSLYNGYSARYEYDDKGRVEKTTYYDEKEEPMILSSGYSSLVHEYYETNGLHKGKAEKDYYYLPDGKPASLSLGQFGEYKEYDKNGQISLITYLNSAGNPMVTNKGYTSVAYTYYADNTVQTMLYYDINGNPFRMSEGQYGIKKINGQTIFLNADGTEQFNIKTFIYNYSGLVIIIAITLVILSILVGNKLNCLLLITYIGVIIYFTLLYREKGDYNIGMFYSYSIFLTNAEARASILKNIWLFVALGAILYQIYPHKSVLIFPLFLSICIELTQYVMATGLCELDDMISNGMGGGIGYVISCFAQLNRKRSTYNKVESFIL